VDEVAEYDRKRREHVERRIARMGAR
jgi:hypothetical protein